MRRSLGASQRRVAVLLRNLYIQGEPDPLAVILGATSLDEVMAGIDGLARATAQNERLATRGDAAGAASRAAARDLAGSATAWTAPVRRRARGTRRLAAAVAGQRADGRGDPPAGGR